MYVTREGNILLRATCNYSTSGIIYCDICNYSTSGIIPYDICNYLRHRAFVKIHTQTVSFVLSHLQAVYNYIHKACTTIYIKDVQLHT
jgi:hypothetical protein